MKQQLYDVELVMRQTWPYLFQPQAKIFPDPEDQTTQIKISAKLQKWKNIAVFQLVGIINWKRSLG